LRPEIGDLVVTMEVKLFTKERPRRDLVRVVAHRNNREFNGLVIYTYAKCCTPNLIFTYDYDEARPATEQDIQDAALEKTLEG